MKPYKTEKWQYERPAMQIVEIRQRGLLMTSSTRQGYGTPIEDDWADE